MISVKSSEVVLSWEASPPMTNEATDEVESYEVREKVLNNLNGCLFPLEKIGGSWGERSEMGKEERG